MRFRSSHRLASASFSLATKTKPNFAAMRPSTCGSLTDETTTIRAYHAAGCAVSPRAVAACA